MPMLPGGPDYPAARPRRGRVLRGLKASRKPVGKKTTPKNVYRSPAPPGRPAPATPGAPGAAALPAAPAANTYPEYAGVPWAQSQLAGIDRDQASHQAYAGQVGTWLSRSLQGLTGVDPSSPGLNPQVQQQYLANIAGHVGGALNAAATATPMAPGSTTPGGVVQGNNAFLGEAARTANAQRSSAAIQMAQTVSALNTLQSNIYAQGAVRAYADVQAGLPALYADRRNKARTAIDQFLVESKIAAAKAEEDARHNRVTEATGAWNARNNYLIAMGQLGLKADDQAFDQTQDLNAASTPAPYGFVSLPDGSFRRDPTVPNASSSGAGADAPKLYDANQLRKEGFVRLNPKAGKVWKDRATRAKDGSLWIKKGKGSSGPKPEPGQPAQKVYEKLIKASDDGLISTDRNKATPDLLRFLKPLQPSKGKAWDAWFAETLAVLERVDPDYKQLISGYVTRRIKAGEWKGTF